MSNSQIHTSILPSGATFLFESMPAYHTATIVIRIMGGVSSEAADQGGSSHLIEQCLDKGTAELDARQIADQFDTLGSQYSVIVGRESWTTIASCLPEHVVDTTRKVFDLLLGATFPANYVNVSKSLAVQALASMQDPPGSLLRRAMMQQAYGTPLGRHTLATPEALATHDNGSLREQWSSVMANPTIEIAAAGPVDQAHLTEVLNNALGGVPCSDKTITHTVNFAAGNTHIEKDIAQTHIGLSFLGVPQSNKYATAEDLCISILSGGMSARLFTEVREKLGLVYSVGASNERPRGAGMIHVTAATTPERCAQTYEVLLRELSRLKEDVTEAELSLAKTRAISGYATSGASVQSRACELLADYFHKKEALPIEAHIERIQAVTLSDIKTYLDSQDLSKVSIVTLGKEQPTLS